MTAHELARKLLAGPDLPVLFDEEWDDCEVWERADGYICIDAVDEEEDETGIALAHVPDDIPFVPVGVCDHNLAACADCVSRFMPMMQDPDEGA